MDTMTACEAAEQAACERLGYDAAVAAAEDAARAKQREIDALVDADPAVAAARAAAEAADKAWNEFPGDFATDDEWEPQRCALSGLPIFVGDHVLVDENTGEVVLKAALGVALDEEGAFVLAPGSPSAIPGARLEQAS